MADSKHTWEYYGKIDPYYAVVTLDQYRQENLTSVARSEFFRLGQEQISDLWKEIETHFRPCFHPKRSLDFGCGVGRLAVPIAQRSASLAAVDVSMGMLQEAKRNCEFFQCENVRFLQTDKLLETEDKFDFIHSFIVFQHIRNDIGIRLLENIIRRLDTGGIGALHFAYSQSKGDRESIFSRVYKNVPLLYWVRNRLKGGRDEPIIPVYTYDLNRVLRILQDNNCHNVKLHFTDHAILGVLLIFEKQESHLF